MPNSVLSNNIDRWPIFEEHVGSNRDILESDRMNANGGDKIQLKNDCRTMIWSDNRTRRPIPTEGHQKKRKKHNTITTTEPKKGKITNEITETWWFGVVIRSIVRYPSHHLIAIRPTNWTKLQSIRWSANTTAICLEGRVDKCVCVCVCVCARFSSVQIYLRIQRHADVLVHVDTRRWSTGR